jgi:hypothetical protein
LVVAIGLLIAGFLARRMMMPRAMHYLTYRAPGAAQPIVPGAPDSLAEPAAPSDRQSARVASPDEAATRSETLASPAADATASGGEHLTASDRRALDDILKRKSK